MAEYTELAVDACRDYYASNYQTHLTAVENDVGLGAGELTAPLQYLDHFVPWDTQSPMFMAFDEEMRPDDPGGQRNGVFVVGCSIVLTYKGDADLQAGELRMRRYLSAAMRGLDPQHGDPTFAGRVIQALFMGADMRSEVMEDQSASRQVATIGLDVWVES